MLKYLIALILAASWSLAGAATITIPAMADMTSKDSGVKPVCVTFDASGVTQTGNSDPFRNLIYTWSFGDTNPDLGSWSYGAVTGRSKNHDTGPIAGHCFEVGSAAGTSYTVTLTVTCQYDVTDSLTCPTAETTQQTGTITVYGYDKAGLTVSCFYETTAGTCPNSGTAYNLTDFDADIFATYCDSANSVCLFKRDDDFTYSVASALTVAGPIRIGAYGSGADPVFTAAAEHHLFTVNADVTDFAISDIKVVGRGDLGGTTAIISAGWVGDGLGATGITLLRVTGDTVTNMIITQGSPGAVLQDVFIQDSTATNIQAGADGASGGSSVYGGYKSSSFLGNSFGPQNIGSQHVLRFQPLTKSVVAHNYISTPGGSGKKTLALRAINHVGGAGSAREDDSDTYFSNIHNNYFYAMNSAQAIELGGQEDQNDWISDIIFAGNYIRMGPQEAAAPTSFNALYGFGSRKTIKNNIVDSSELIETVGASMTGFITNGDATPQNQVHEDVHYLNNTCYAGANTVELRCVLINGSATYFSAITRPVVRNTLAYGTNTGGTRYSVLMSNPADIVDEEGGPGTFGNTALASMATDPFATTPVLGDMASYAPASGGHADDDGVIALQATGYFQDITRCHDKTGAFRSGAVTYRPNAICTK